MVNTFRSNKILILSGLFLVIAIVGVLITTGKTPTGSILSGSQGRGTMQFTTPTTVVINQPFEMSVDIDTDEKSVNAAGIYLRFDPDKLQLLNLDTRSSFCQFYPERKYDNNLGIISLACGSPHPGVKGQNTIMILEFMPVGAGDTVLRTAPESQLLMSDGKGTDILGEVPLETIKVVNSL